MQKNRNKGGIKTSQMSSPGNKEVKSLFEQKLTKGEQTQIQIAEKGIRLLAEYGLSEFTLDKVAKKMKTTRSHLVYHFQSGEGLLIFMLRYIILTAEKLTLESVEKSPNGDEFIGAVVRGGMKWFELYPDHAKCWVSFFDLAIRNDEFRKINHQVRVEGLQRIMQYLKKKKPGLSAEKAESAARAIQSLMAGEIINYFSTEATIKYSQLTEETVTNAQRLIKY